MRDPGYEVDFLLTIATIKASDTLEHQPTVWPVPNACAQPYHPVSGIHGQLVVLALLGLDH